MHELYNLHTLVGREEVPSSIDTRFDFSVNPILPLIASSGIGINSLSLGPIEGLESGSTRRVVFVRSYNTDRFYCSIESLLSF